MAVTRRHQVRLDAVCPLIKGQLISLQRMFGQIGASATVNAGNSPGTLILAGDVDLLGTLQTEIVSNSFFDVLEIQGAVTLSNTTTFDFIFDNSFEAIDGDSFDFLSAFNIDFGLGADFFDLSDLSRYTVAGLTGDFDWSVSFVDNFSITDQAPSFLSLNLFDNRPSGTPVSEPATLPLFGLAVLLMGWFRRRSV